MIHEKISELKKTYLIYSGLSDVSRINENHFPYRLFKSNISQKTTLNRNFNFRHFPFFFFPSFIPPSLFLRRAGKKTAFGSLDIWYALKAGGKNYPFEVIILGFYLILNAEVT